MPILRFHNYIWKIKVDVINFPLDLGQICNFQHKPFQSFQLLPSKIHSSVVANEKSIVEFENRKSCFLAFFHGVKKKKFATAKYLNKSNKL